MSGTPVPGELILTQLRAASRGADIPDVLRHCRTPDLALNSMRLDRVVNEAQVGPGVCDLLSIQVFAKSDEGLLGSVIG